MGKMENVDGYLHVTPRAVEGEGDDEMRHGIIRREDGEKTPEVGDVVTYISTGGREILARILENPGKLKEGYAYIRTLNTPERLRGFVAELGGVAKKTAVLAEHSKHQDAVNALHEQLGQVREFIPPEISDDLRSAYGQSQDQIRLFHNEALGNEEGGARALLSAELALQGMRAEDSLRESTDNEKTTSGLARLRGLGSKFTSAMRGGLLSGVLLVATLSSGDRNEGPQTAFAEGVEATQVYAPEESPYENLEILEIPADAVVRKGEGVSHAFARQLKGNATLAEALGYDGSANSLAEIMKKAGYMGGGSEVRVAVAGSAYQLEINADGDVGVAVYGPDGTLAGHRIFQQEQKTDLEHFEYKH